MTRVPHDTTWPGVAVALGFPTRRAGKATRNGHTLSRNGNWLELRSRRALRGDPLHELVGRPGLWRGLESKRGTQLVFDLPPLGPDTGGDAPDPRHPYAALVEWATSTQSGRPEASEPPCEADLAAWLPPALRHIRAGEHVAAIEVVAKPEQLALIAAPLVRLSPELSEARLDWVRALCHDAQRRWRMVRFGLDEAERCVRAEVDLSGAPRDRIRSLFEQAGTALASSAAWALPGLALVVDSSVESRWLDRSPHCPDEQET